MAEFRVSECKRRLHSPGIPSQLFSSTLDFPVRRSVLLSTDWEVRRTQILSVDDALVWVGYH